MLGLYKGLRVGYLRLRIRCIHTTAGTSPATVTIHHNSDFQFSIFIFDNVMLAAIHDRYPSTFVHSVYLSELDASSKSGWVSLV